MQCLFGSTPTSRRSTPIASSTARRRMLQKSMEKLSVRPAHQPRRRRRRRPGDLARRCAPRSTASPQAHQNALDGISMVQTGRRRAERGARDPAARPRARRPVQQRHPLARPTAPRSPSRSRQLSAEVSRIVTTTQFNGIDLLSRRHHRHLPGRRERRRDDRPGQRQPRRHLLRQRSSRPASASAPTSPPIDIAVYRDRRRPRHLRRRPEPPRAHHLEPRRPTRRTCPPPRAASATSTWPPRWSTSPSTRSSRQSGTAMLAQANQLPQSVLKLLQ